MYVHVPYKVKALHKPKVKVLLTFDLLLSMLWELKANYCAIHKY